MLKISKKSKHDLLGVQNSIMKVAMWAEDKLGNTRPEFGAYMAYSARLEFGYSAANGTQVPGRPHLMPAVTYSMPFISATLKAFITKNLDTGNLTPSKELLEQAWEVTLNAQPRQFAVENSPYLYGFHRRSIRGYGNNRDAPTDQQIEADTMDAISEAQRSNVGGK